MDNNLFKKENLNIWLSPIINIVLTIALLIVNIYIGIVALFFTIISIYNAIDNYNNKKDEFKNFVDKLDFAFDSFTKKAIFDMPFSIIILSRENKILWHNSDFKEMIPRKESLINEDIDEILPAILRDVEKTKKDEDKNYFNYSYEQRDYEVHFSYLEKEKTTMLYLIDITDKINTYNNYVDEQITIMNIRVDNIEELNQNISSEKRPIVYAEIDTIITSYFHKYGSVIKKSENGKYFAITYKKALREMMKNKFEFVEKVRNVKVDGSIVPTLSVGIGYLEENPRLNEKSANAAMDIALGRGGDQIVIKSNDKLEYFGGKNQATEKRTRVRARVIAHALAQYIEKSTEVFISGHKNPDMDSFGSSIGLWRAVRNKNKNAYIVLSEITPAIKNIYDYMTEKIDGLKESIVSPDKAYELAKESSLFIITDNHRVNSTEEPRLFDKVNSIFVIDHHRRGNDYIDNATLSYIEPSSSSASELVTEMLMYIEKDIRIDKEVAEALLAGITVDTRNFSKQTGVRTFEAATILKQNGADTNVVNNLFVEDFNTVKYRSEIIANASVFRERFIIGIFDKEIDESTLIAAQAANILLDIENIDASFVITKIETGVHISARSNEKISVQLIMEKLEGGGHRGIAATQMNIDIDGAEKLLKKAILEYIEEDN